MKRILIGLLIALGAIVVLAVFLVWWLNFFPAPVMDAQLHCNPKTKAAPPKAGTKIRILSWNIQYSASRKHHFFYDGGKAVHVPKQDILDTLKQLTAVVKEVKPDIILWQELDRNSTRTQYIDQLQKLWKANPNFHCWTSTPYHWSRFVPSPGHKFLRRVDFHLGIFSRFPIKRAVRHRLAALNKDPVTKAFHLKRAILEVEIPMASGAPLILFDTHFSAFSYGDGTLQKQVKKLIDLAQGAEKKGNPWLAAGDLNLLPPGDDPARLGKDAAYYAKKGIPNPIEPLFKALRPALTLADYNKAPQKYNTYLPFGTSKTDRWIDHAFLGKKIQLHHYEVLQKHVNISDHLPIVIDFSIKP